MIWGSDPLPGKRHYLEQFRLEKPGPISVAARFGLDRYLEKLLGQGHIYETLDSLSSLMPRRYLTRHENVVEQHPLVLASIGRYYPAATILLELTHTEEADFYRALYTACFKHNEQIVELLIARWPFEEIQISHYVIIDSEKLRELLLSRNVKITIGSLEFLAGQQGASSWIRLALKNDWDSDFDECGLERKKVLKKAAPNKCLENFQLLIAHPKFDLALQRVNKREIRARTLFDSVLVKAAKKGIVRLSISFSETDLN